MGVKQFMAVIPTNLIKIFPYSNTTNKAEWLPDDNHEQGESQDSIAATRMADL